MKILYWHKKQKSIQLAQAFVDACDRAGVDCYFYDGELQPDTDLAVAIGGDGTLLTLVHLLCFARVPFLAINGGTVGFLAQDYQDMDGLVQSLLDGEYALVDKRLLEVFWEDGKQYALGDVAVCRGDTVGTVTVDISVDGEHVFAYRGDGVVVATPLGSTGYSLSGGGAVLAPDLEAMIITPIAAHSLCARSVVVGADACVALRVSGRDGVAVSLDGVSVLEGSSVDLTVSSADKWLQLVQFDSKYFERLTKKLATW